MSVYQSDVVDTWTVREKLALGSAVQRMGDNNWSAISRLMPPISDKERPADWFSSKHCAYQYVNLLEGATENKRSAKTSSARMTPLEQILKTNTVDRIQELHKLIEEDRAEHIKLKKEMEQLKRGTLSAKRLEEIKEAMNNDDDDFSKRFISLTDANLTQLKEEVYLINRDEIKARNSPLKASLAPLSVVETSAVLTTQDLNEDAEKLMSQNVSLETTQTLQADASTCSNDTVSITQMLSGTCNIKKQTPVKIESVVVDDDALSTSAKYCTPKTHSPTVSESERSVTKLQQENDLEDETVSSVLSVSHQSHNFGLPVNAPVYIASPEPDNEKSVKLWKRAIMVVLQTAMTHKHGSIFLHPVTNDIAPGYTEVVLKPMDLSTLRKRLEAGEIISTHSFLRDLFRIFVNAVMYNNSDHFVYQLAMEMWADLQRVVDEVLVVSGSTDLLSASLSSSVAGKTLRHPRRSMELGVSNIADSTNSITSSLDRKRRLSHTSSESMSVSEASFSKKRRTGT